MPESKTPIGREVLMRIPHQSLGSPVEKNRHEVAKALRKSILVFAFFSLCLRAFVAQNGILIRHQLRLCQIVYHLQDFGAQILPLLRTVDLVPMEIQDVERVNDAVDPCSDLGERNVQTQHRHRARDAVQESQHVRRIDIENGIPRMIFEFNISTDIWIDDPAAALPSHPVPLKEMLDIDRLFKYLVEFPVDLLALVGIEAGFRNIINDTEPV